jgi:hypothetical protein
VSLLALLVTLVAGMLSFRVLQRVSAEEDAGGPVARSRFMAMVGVLISLLMIGVIVALWLPVFIHNPCET